MYADENVMGYECADVFWDVAFPISRIEEADNYIDEFSDEEFLKCIDLGYECE